MLHSLAVRQAMVVYSALSCCCFPAVDMLRSAYCSVEFLCFAAVKHDVICVWSNLQSTFLPVLHVCTTGGFLASMGPSCRHFMPAVAIQLWDSHKL